MTEKLFCNDINANPENQRQLLPQPGHPQQRVPRLRVKVNQNVDVTVGSCLTAGYRAEHTRIRRAVPAQHSLHLVTMKIQRPTQHTTRQAVRSHSTSVASVELLRGLAAHSTSAKRVATPGRRITTTSGFKIGDTPKITHPCRSETYGVSEGDLATYHTHTILDLTA